MRFNLYKQLRVLGVRNSFSVVAKYYFNTFIEKEIFTNYKLILHHGKDINQIPITEGQDLREFVNCMSSTNKWDKIRLDLEPRIIFDLGANRGFSSYYWYRRYPDAEYILIEADPRNVDYLHDLVKRNDLHRFTIFQAAITDHNGMVKMAMADAHSMTRMVSGTEIENKDLTRTLYNKGEIQVQGYELGALIAKMNYSRIDLMKIDIEGAEMQVIATIDKWQKYVQAFLMEVHKGMTDENYLRDKIEKAGYSINYDHSDWFCQKSDR